MIRFSAIGAGLALALGVAAPAHAGVLYQSVPDLTVVPDVNGYCSQCSGNGQNVGQTFTLAGDSLATGLTFAVTGFFNWPTGVSVNIFRDGPGNTLGANVYSQTFASFLSDTPTGHDTDVVSVALGSVGLTAGTYDIVLSNPGSLAIPAFAGGQGKNIIMQNQGATPLSGQSYYSTGLDTGIILTGSAVPEPASWALLLLGIGFGGAALRRQPQVRRAVA